MAVTSRAAAVAQFDDNSDYESDLTGAKARLFIQAARVMLRYPERSRGAEGEVQYSHTSVRQELEAARSFLASVTSDNVTTAPTTTPRQFSMERFTR